jgi:hypothetical protein
LLAWRHQRQGGSGGAPESGLDIESVRVDRDRHHRHAGELQCGARERKTGLLHPRGRAFKLEPADGQAERTGEPARHQHLGGRAADAARDA